MKSFQCDLRQLGKHTCTCYGPRVSKHVASSFALVDFDIWGSGCICSSWGYFYFATLIDNFLFLGFPKKNHHYEVFCIFQKFLVEIET